jgi:hypothetical protein
MIVIIKEDHHLIRITRMMTKGTFINNILYATSFHGKKFPPKIFKKIPKKILKKKSSPKFSKKNPKKNSPVSINSYLTKKCVFITCMALLGSFRLF